MPLAAKCACAAMGRSEHHPLCPQWRPARVVAPIQEEEEGHEVAPPPSDIPEEQANTQNLPSQSQDSKEEPMARKAAVKKNVEPATAREARAWLLENAETLPEGVTVGARGRLSAAARDHFTAQTGRPISE